MSIRFVKMHGIGNDYVYLDAVGDPSLARRGDLAELAKRVSDRHRGIGSDGLILVCLPTEAGRAAGAQVRMRMFNADGSESEMCGNGVRCVAKFAHDRLGYRERSLRVETGRGVLSIEIETGEFGRVERATVDMGEPILDAARVPVDPARLKFDPEGVTAMLPDRIELSAFVPVSMGNPHAVFFGDEVWAGGDAGGGGEGDGGVKRFLAREGPALERHSAFPNRANIHLVKVLSRTRARMHTWERGAGMTQACGTGACAVLVAGVLTGRLERDALLELPGGELRIRWDAKSNHVFMTGSATEVCEGTWSDTGDGASTPAPVRSGPRPTLTTERLILRPPEMTDAPAMARLAGDKAIYAMTLLIPHPYRLEDAERWISTHKRTWESGLGLDLSIFLRESGELVGGIGMVINPVHRVGEIGYWIGTPYWNRGYATEAARALISFGLGELKLERMGAYHFIENPASGRVLEKAGMTKEGLCRAYRRKDGVSRDSVLYSIVERGAGRG